MFDQFDPTKLGSAMNSWDPTMSATVAWLIVDSRARQVMFTIRVMN